MSEDNQNIDAPDVPEVDHQAEVEARAREQGWVPKEEWTGEGKWRDAESFLDRGELFAKIDEVRRQNRELRKTQDAFAQHLETVRKAEYNKAVAALKAQKRQALIDGDPDAVVDIDEKIDELKLAAAKVEQAPTPQSQAELHPEFVNWTNRNTWYVSDAPMRAFADALGNELQAQGGKSPAEILKEVETRVRKEFPNRFTNPNRAKPAAVADPSAKANGGGSGGRDSFQLTSEERKVMERLVSIGALTREEYIADIKAKKGN